MNNNEIINALALFLRDETLEECPINIVSRENVEGETAELVWFEWGEEKHKCPAILWSDGTVVTPTDWQAGYDESFKIEDCDRWTNSKSVEFIIYDGMPCQLVI